jgi:DNA-directed RNA polymerase omega subunit
MSRVSKASAKEKEKGKEQEKEGEAKGANKFQSVILAARRARELNQGINVTQEMEGRKITSIAIEELEHGKLKMEDEDEDGEVEAEEEDKD